MAKYNRPAGIKKSIGTIIITSIFAIIGIVCILIGYANKFLLWLRTFGIVILVISFPILVYIIYKLILKKVKEM